MEKADIGIVGLAVMGENLALNMESKGFRVAVYNRTASKVDAFLAGRGKGKNFIGCHSYQELADSLKSPRKILLMIKAGKPVDEAMESLRPLLAPGDILMDGGNANFNDTARRAKWAEEKGLLFMGVGISGGEEGALTGPSIMPGGSRKAWDAVKPILQSVAAQVDGSPCCDWVGEGGSGHYVKMVHNGIEYGDMQLISEAYLVMRDGLYMTPDEMAAVFAQWNQGPLDSYLIEITADILAKKDEDGLPLIDKILDAAGQKGTGKWTSQSALDEGVPLTLITEAVYSRFLSSDKEGRLHASGVLQHTPGQPSPEREAVLIGLHDALYAAKIISYAQGFLLLRAAAASHGWQLDYGSIAMLWRGGCIIRSAFLGKISQAFRDDPGLANLLVSPFFAGEIAQAQHGLRSICALAALQGIPAPAMMSALSFLDGIRSPRLGANLLQAQRDYFGAHTYERVDRPRGEFFHTNWTGTGGDTASSAYNA